MSRAEVIEKALRLSAGERGEVIRELIRSLESEGGEEDPAVVEAAWGEEIARRVELLAAGESKEIPVAEAVEAAGRSIENRRSAGR